MILSSLQTGQHKYRLLGFRHLYSVLGLTVIAAIAYGTFYAPILYSDDWSLMIGRWYNGSLNWFDLNELRPLFKARIKILYAIFGLNIHAFYIVLWGLNVLNAIQIYFIAHRFLPRNTPIAFSIAAIILVYPADFTHMWLTMIQVRVVVTLTLLYAHLLLIYADTGRWIALFGSLLCLVVSFGMHEVQFGVTMIWCLLLVFMKRGMLWKSLLPLLSPLVIGFAFTLWHAVGTSLLGVRETQRYVNDIVFTPSVMIQRLLKGFQIMVWAWIEPLMLGFSLNIWQAFVVILFTVIFCSLMAYSIIRIYNKKSRNVSLTHNQYVSQLRIFVMMMLVGPIFIAVGYIPVITLFQPSLFPIGSRVNLFPLMGATVTLVSMMAVVVMNLRRKQPEINAMMLGAITPLVLLGIMVQLQAQYEDRLSWQEQKQIWHEFFELVPDLKRETDVFFIFFEQKEQDFSLRRTKRRIPFHGTGDVSAALNILYGSYALYANITSKELLLEEGVKNYYSGKITPYDHTVFVAYDGDPKRLRIVEDLETEGVVDFSIPTYTPYEHIIETPATSVSFRWLVGVVQ